MEGQGASSYTPSSVADLVSEMRRAERDSRFHRFSGRSGAAEQSRESAKEACYRECSTNLKGKSSRHLEREEYAPCAEESTFEADAELAERLQRLEMESYQQSQTLHEACAQCGRDLYRSSGMLGRLRNKVAGANGRKYCERCYRCAQCDNAIKSRFISGDHGELYHVDCAYEKLVPNCRACGLKVVGSIHDKITFSKTRYWNEILCGHHIQEELRRCSSCQRLQPLCLSATGIPEEYATLSDGKLICLSCLSLNPMLSTRDADSLYDEIFYFLSEQLGMKLRYRPPFHLVTYDVLNSSKSSKHGFHDHGDVRGVTLSEEYTRKKPSSTSGFDMLLGRSQLHQDNASMRTSEVSAILVLVGLPFLTTGEILAHELTHAFFRLNNFGKLDPQIEEGICQLISYLWLNYKLQTEMQRSESRDGSYSQKSEQSLGEQHTLSSCDLCKFLLWQIEQHPSPIYGDGFKLAKLSYDKYGFDRMVESVRLRNSLPQ